jgi:UDP-GlcNAc:undecaprenyl-phosphate GlcNAc-1-phosphate transferase
MSLLIAFLAALVLTVLFTPLVGYLARARGLYAQPSIDRWHKRPVPVVGGVAMMMALLLVSLVAGITQPLLPVLVASTLMFVVGLVDDFRPLPPATKFVLQMLVAAVLLYLLPDIHITGHATTDRLLGFVWIVGITNAVNLLDNMDGLAGGVSLLAASSLLVALMANGTPVGGPLGAALVAFIGVTAGFLIFNFHPASIFMGDSGSHLLGCFLAGTSLMATSVLSAHPVPVAAVPVVVLLIPIFDTAFVTVARGLSGRSAFLGGRDHTSHRLAALGIGERRAVLVLYALTILGGATALGLMNLPAGLAWGMVGLYASLLVLIGVYLGRVQVGRDERDAEPPLPTELAVRYPYYEVGLDTLLIAGAYYLAFIGRFRDAEFDQFLPYFARSVPIIVGIQIAALWLSGQYRRTSNVGNAREILALVRASLLGVAASVIFVLYTSRFEGYSRWVFLFDAVLAPAFIVGSRVVVRTLDEYLRLRRSRGRAVLIFGAGKGGAMAARELLQNGSIGLTPIGLVDDDPAKRRMRVEGLPVVAGLDDLAAVLDRRPGHVAAIVVAIADLPRDRLDRVCEIAIPRGIAVRRLRVDLEEVRVQSRSAGVVRFPGA